MRVLSFGRQRKPDTTFQALALVKNTLTYSVITSLQAKPIHNQETLSFSAPTAALRNTMSGYAMIQDALR